MLLSALLKDAKIEYSGSDCEISQIVCNSQMACENSLFVCIKGFTSDGHGYAGDAYGKGCRVFVAERELSLPDDAVVVICENTRKALALISAAYYGFPAKKLQIVGITGTKGKTTTALMLASIAEQNGLAAGYIGSNGVDFGDKHYKTGNTTPESIDLHRYFAEMVEEGIKAVFIEVSSQALYLDRVYGIDFFLTVFTNLAPDHIGAREHPTFEHYLASKKKLFFEYESEFSTYNIEDEHVNEMICGGRFYNTFGLSKGHFYASDIQPFMENGELGVRFNAHVFNRSFPAKLHMAGEFNVVNAMCAINVAHRLDIQAEDSVAALENTFVRGRFEMVQTPLDAVFIIDYAHNGLSLTSVLETLRSYSPNRLWCVVGSVGGRTKGRRSELGEVASRLADVVVLTADNPDKEDVTSICEEMRNAFVRDVPCEIIPDRKEAIEYAVANAGKGDIVLFAGKGHEDYQVLAGMEKIHFDEREIVREGLELLRNQ